MINPFDIRNSPPVQEGQFRLAGTGWSISMCSFIIYCLVLPLITNSAHAQLISPGELSTAHASLEGVSNCTSCHQLGQVGISNTKCLDCHTPLEERIDQKLGFHATVADQSCGDCHKDHFGLDFDVLNFIPDEFDHGLTEYALVGAHTSVECRSCHQPELIVSPLVREIKAQHGALQNTWLGLSGQCATCHGEESVHGDQFEATDCGTCHDEMRWEEQPLFDHDETTFPLTGQHVEVACSDCHKPFELQPDIIHFADLPAETCESCHVDVHEDALDDNCATCHITDGWDLFTADFPAASFDHDLTDFPLIGRHAEAECSSCHGKPAANTEDFHITYQSASIGSTFPDPLFADCMSCHTDNFHGGVFEDSPGGAVCDNCHGESGWIPTSYDLTRHNEQSAFPLTGAHLATPCFACHQNPDLGQTAAVFHFEEQECQTCHTGMNPHGDQFSDEAGAIGCDSCHGTEGWTVAGIFDHAETRFPLTGQHGVASCESCHVNKQTPAGIEVQQFRGTELACATCHADDNPHEGQFEGDTCDTCHDATSFFVAEFNHDNTRFSLDGAHQGVACGSCHNQEQNPAGNPFVRYKPLKMECQDCHDDLN